MPMAMPTTAMPLVRSFSSVTSAAAALALWQAGRSEEAYRLMKSALLASMYLGVSPGNVNVALSYR